jgi:pimeloyl-ACP methyl ester carboxylesterase
MADDAVAVLDALGLQSAHVVGISLGGMIAQLIATRHPDRVRTLTSISSTPSARVGWTWLGTLLRFAKVAKKPVTDAESLARQMIGLQPFTGSPGYPPDLAWLRELATESYERGYDLAGAQRQTAAIAAAGDRRPDLAALRVPTLVVHGESDQIIRPIAGRETAKAIPGAVLVTYPGMGHDLHRELWPAVINEIHDLAQRGSPKASPRSDAPQT